MSDDSSQQIILQGISGSPGVCIGKAYLVDKEGVDIIPKYSIAPDKLSREKQRFKKAVKKASDELRQIMRNTPEELRKNAKILETHVVMLKDKMLYGRTIETIEKEKINAEWALKKVVSVIKPMFESMNDPYLHDRAADVVHVSERITSYLTGAPGPRIADINKRVILVARDLSPAETSQIQLEKIMGFVTDGGGKASHTSIIARSLEIPAVLGLEKATAVIHNDDIIIVDGMAGTVVINPTEETLLDASERKEQFEIRRAGYARRGHLPARTKDNRHVSVLGNIELPEEVVAILDKGGDGIGLYRTEFQYITRQGFPSEEELFEKYKDVVDVMPDKPVTIRTLDINGDKAVSYTSEKEDNPVMGLRAIRYCLKKPEVFKTQLRAILRAAYYGNVRLLLPMISRLDEVHLTKKLLAEVADSLAKDGLPYKADIPIGVMVEVPSTAILADIIAKEIDFFSIGTNDLIQYTMAVDRGNRHVDYLYNPLNPSVLRLIYHVTQVGRRHKIPVFMCGEMAGEALFAPILLGLGLQELSTNSQSIPIIKNAIRLIDEKSSREFLKKILDIPTAMEIERLVNDTYGDLLSNGAMDEEAGVHTRD